MVELARTKGLKQVVSTTLAGQQQCIDFLAKTDAFEQIVLHLPDVNGLMEHGSLVIDDQYLDNLDRFLNCRLGDNNLLDSRIGFHVIGKDVNSQIYALLKKRMHLGEGVRRVATSRIHSRAGSISHLASKSAGLSIGRRLSHFNWRLRLPFNPLKWIRLPSYICGYKKLGQPVLLPNGRLNICCMDYRLTEIIGDLSTSSFSKIMQDWMEARLGLFSSGDLQPCNKCEYYRRMTIYDLAVWALRRYRRGVVSSLKTGAWS
jgi:hypothetical protein